MIKIHLAQHMDHGRLSHTWQSTYGVLTTERVQTQTKPETHMLHAQLAYLHTWTGCRESNRLIS